MQLGLANALRKKLSIFFKTRPFLDVMVINFENAASHKYVVHAAKILCMARSEMSVCLFLVLIKISHKLCFENSICKQFSRNSANSFWACNGRCVASYISIVYSLRIQLFLNQTQKSF